MVQKRDLLKGIGTAVTTFGIAGVASARDKAGIVRTGTIDDPVTDQEIRDVTQDFYSTSDGFSQSTTSAGPTVEVNTRDHEKILGYAFGLDEGTPKYLIVSIDMNPRANVEENQQPPEDADVDTTTSAPKSDQSGITELAHQRVNNIGNSLTGDTTAVKTAEEIQASSGCSKKELIDDTTLEGWPCPWITGENKVYEPRREDGYDRIGDDDFGRLRVQDQLFYDGDDIGVVSFHRSNPSTSFPGSNNHVCDTAYNRHAFDENTSQDPDSVGAKPKGTVDSQVNSFSLSAGPGSLGVGVGWNVVEAELDFNVNSRLSQWSTLFKSSRDDTKSSSYASAAQYGSNVNSGDDVMRAVTRSKFSRFLLGAAYDSKTYRSETLYSYSE